MISPPAPTSSIPPSSTSPACAHRRRTAAGDPPCRRARRGIASRQPGARVQRPRRYRCKAEVSRRARPGVVNGWACGGASFGLDGTNVNELTHQRLTDIGARPSFYDCLVEVEAVAGWRHARAGDGWWPGWARPAVLATGGCAWAAAAAVWATTASRCPATWTWNRAKPGERLAGRRRHDPAPLKRLALSQRRCATSRSQVLKLPDNASYRAYADLQRPAAVWKRGGRAGCR